MSCLRLDQINIDGVNVDALESTLETEVVMSSNPFESQIAAGVPGADDPAIAYVGDGALPSAFAVTDFASAGIAAAGREVARLAGVREVEVDRVLASMWFASSISPIGWQLPAVWDPIAGDYAAANGWIRLHTNAPHHRAAALLVLDCAEDRASVASAVAERRIDDLETAVVEAGGAAAAMRDRAAWQNHPQGHAVDQEPLVAHRAAESSVPWAWEPSSDRPLHGIRVLDLTRILAGPVATRFLAGYGADVLRIDPLDWDEPSVAPDVTLGKRCARLDLRSDSGRACLGDLIREADVFVHGYRSDALARLGFDEAVRRELNPSLIDLALDAYGWTGPWSTRRGFDSLVQMSCGIAHAGMEAAGVSKPTPLPVQALDHAAGHLLASAAVRGVNERLCAGTGSTWRVSLARVACLLMDGPSGSFEDTLDGATPQRYDVREHTPYGDLHRLPAPLRIPGIECRWDRPATTLGSSDPSFLPRRGGLS